MQRYRWVLSAFALLIVVPLLASGATASASSCSVSVSAQTSVVNYPDRTLPPPNGLAFGETLLVNYTTADVNQSITIQYHNGTGWFDLQTFTGNGVGFTEVDHGLNTAWARFGTNTVRAMDASCFSSPTSFVVQADPTAPLVDVAIYAAVAALLALFFLTGKRLGLRRFVILAGAVYLFLSPLTGQRYDVYFLLSSGIRILQHVNPFEPGNPAVYPGPLKWAYPPLYAAYSALSFAIYQLLTGAQLPSVQALTYHGWLTSVYSIFQAYVPDTLPILVFLLKIPMVASVLMTGILLKKMTGSKLAAVGFLANPLVILVGAAWGQLDPIATLLAVASIYSFERQKPYHAYFFASLGAAVKVWPIIMIPMMLVISLRQHGAKSFKPLVATLPALLATVGLYSLFGNPLESLYVLVYARGIPTFAGAFSVNGLTWQEALFVLNSPPIPLFLFVGIPLYIGILGWMYWTKDAGMVKWLVVSILIFFLTYNYVNPQYFYWLIPLLILQRNKRAVIAFTALPLIFIALAYNIFYFVSPAILTNQFAFGASIFEQLKVSAFYQSPILFVLVAGLIPTFWYLVLVYSEVNQAKSGNRLKGSDIGESGASLGLQVLDRPAPDLPEDPVATVGAGGRGEP